MGHTPRTYDPVTSQKFRIQIYTAFRFYYLSLYFYTLLSIALSFYFSFQYICAYFGHMSLTVGLNSFPFETGMSVFKNISGNTVRSKSKNRNKYISRLFSLNLFFFISLPALVPVS